MIQFVRLILIIQLVRFILIIPLPSHEHTQYLWIRKFAKTDYIMYSTNVGSVSSLVWPIQFKQEAFRIDPYNLKMLVSPAMAVAGFSNYTFEHKIRQKRFKDTKYI